MLSFKRFAKGIKFQMLNKQPSLNCFPTIFFYPVRRHLSFHVSQQENGQGRKAEISNYFQFKLREISNLDHFRETLEGLLSLNLKEDLDREQIQDLLQLCSKYLNSLPKDESNLDKNSLMKNSELFTNLFQSTVEVLDVDTVVLSLKVWCQFPPSLSKPYWNFVEFLITRTNFLNLFQGRHIVELLDSYYQIQERYESDKFAYIYDKCDEYITTKDLDLKENELARILYLYTKCELGSDLLFKTCLKKFNAGKQAMDLINLITCNWCFVSYNQQRKDKTFLVYQKETYDKVLQQATRLNSSQLKQFLWAYQIEREIFG